MKTKQLGHSDLEVSVVGVGCMMFGSMCDQDTTTAIINAALDEGVNFFDTASAYADGASEQLLSQAVGGRRHELVIATKVHPQRMQLNEIVEECDRMTARINQFLAFARPYTPEIESVNVKAIVDELALLLEPRVERAHRASAHPARSC